MASDALPALSGLTEEYARLTKDQYTAGLWVSAMPKALMWINAAQQGFLSRVSPYRAPSWSWACLVSEIRAGDEWDTEDIWPVGCKVNLRNKIAPFGEVTEGVLELKRKLMKGCRDPNYNNEARCSIDISHWPRSAHKNHDRRYVPQKTLEGTLILDTSEQTPLDLWFMKTAKGERGMIGGFVLTKV